MSKQRDKVPERIAIAERWRVAGKKLRTRSPAVFQKMFEMLVTLDDYEEDEPTAIITESHQ